MTAKAAKPGSPSSPRSRASSPRPPTSAPGSTRNHATAPELLVGFHKVGSGKPSITWPQSVDQALCFGWIDGVRRSLGADALHDPLHAAPAAQHLEHDQHAALRRARAQGQVAAAGRAAFAAREAKRSGVYSFEQAKPPALPRAQRKLLRANAKAWAFFTSRPPWYQRTATHWVVSAKKPETRDRRLRTLIADSAAGRTIGPLTRPGDKPA